MFKEFKEFAMRGNVVDMAVGIIIGAAFTTIVTSLVDDIALRDHVDWPSFLSQYQVVVLPA